MKVSRYYIEDGGRLPRGYGVAYYDVRRRQFVCYLIPFNYILNLLRKLYYALADPSMPEIEKKIHKAYMDGKCDGWKDRQKQFEKDAELYLLERETEFRRKYGGGEKKL